MENIIHIIAATDNHYSVLLAALIKSVEQNHKTSEHICFTIIDDGVSNTNKNKITSSVNSDTISVKWVKSKDAVPEGIKLPLDKTSFPLTAYLRIFAPYVIPEESERAIYLDVDTIVLGEISDLWKLDLKGNLFGAIQDVQETVSCSWAGIPNYKELGIPPETKYFNSGVLLFDAPRWRRDQIAHKVMQVLHDNREYVNYADQYGLNAALYNQWLEIDPLWNNFAFKETEGAHLIHFLDIKPIFTTYQSSKKYQELFFHYLNQTPFKGFKIINGNRRTFKKIHTRFKKILLKLRGA